VLTVAELCLDDACQRQRWSSSSTPPRSPSSTAAVQRRCTAAARTSASAVGGRDGVQSTGDAQEPGVTVPHRPSHCSTTQVDVVASWSRPLSAQSRQRQQFWLWTGGRDVILCPVNFYSLCGRSPRGVVRTCRRRTFHRNLMKEHDNNRPEFKRDYKTTISSLYVVF